MPGLLQEWWCNNNVSRDNATCSPLHSDGTLPQNKKGTGKEKAKKRKQDKKGATQSESKAKRRSGDATIKKSPKSKKPSKSSSPSQPPEWPSGGLFSTSFTTVGACVSSADEKALPMPRPPSGDSSPAPSSALYAGPELSPHHNPLHSYEQTKMETSFDTDMKRGSGAEEVKEEPVDLTRVSSPENVTKAESKVQPTSEGSQAEAPKEEESDSWEGSEAGSGGTDILRLVIERRLGSRLPEDQETGYHTDSTPDRSASDNEQDARTEEGNTTVSSGVSLCLSLCFSVYSADNLWALLLIQTWWIVLLFITDFGLNLFNCCIVVNFVASGIENASHGNTKTEGNYTLLHFMY